MTGQPRLLSERCSTCVFRPGNLMRLRPGRLHDLIQQNVAAGVALTCHQTLPHGEHPGFGAAVCRGFYDVIGDRVAMIQIVERLGGFAEVAPPQHEETPVMSETDGPAAPDPIVARVKLEILEDMVSGRVPVTVASFAELHEYVEANEYGGLGDPRDANSRLTVVQVRAMQDAVDAWLDARAARVRRRQSR